MSLTRKVFLYPEAGPFDPSKPINGIQQVVNAQHKHLMSWGWELTTKKAEAEIVASHAGAANHKPVNVAHCHGLYPTGDQQFDRAYYEINARVIDDLRCASVVTVPSEWVGDLLRRDMHLSPEVLPHGLDLEDWPERDRAGLPHRPQLLWNKNRPTDVCHTDPLRAIAKHRQDLDFVTTFLDQSPLPNTQVVGVVPHARMKQLYYDSHVYLATTRETFGIATLEAMAAGLPVVGFNWGATPDLVTKDVGVLVPPDDIDALSDAISGVLASWGRFSHGARLAALRYGWPDVMRRYADLYTRAATPYQGPKVTVVIPCFNYANRVGRAIGSVKTQSIVDLECIVVDDGSIDQSPQVIKTAIGSDKRFRYVRQDNKGVAEARNKGLSMATGEYLCCLDADDAIDNRFLEVCVGALEADPHLDMAYTGLQMTFRGRPNVSKWPTKLDFDQHAAGRCQVPTCNVMRRRVYERTGGYRQRFSPAEDANMWLWAGALGMRMEKVTEEGLFRYDFHDNSLSSAVRNGQRQEPDWRFDLPWTRGHGRVPFAALVKPKDHLLASHPVTNYDQPLVAYVVPVGPNHQGLVLHALDSIESQTDWRWEAIVVDDSPDQDLELPGRPWAKLLRTGGGRGPAIARNMGVRASRAPFLTFLDADDFLMPGYQEEALEAWAPGLYVYPDYWDERGLRHRSQVFNEELMRRKALHSVTFLHERSAWEAIGGFDETLTAWEDWDYTIALAAAGIQGVKLGKPLLVYRFDAGYRREDNKAQGAKAWRAVMNKWEGKPMGCCGGSKKPRRAPVPRATAATRPPVMASAVAVPGIRKPGDENLIKIRYIGVNAGSTLLRSPNTGNKYRVGRASAVINCHPDDVEWLTSRPDMELLAHQAPTESREVASMAQSSWAPPQTAPNGNTLEEAAMREVQGPPGGDPWPPAVESSPPAPMPEPQGPGVDQGGYGPGGLKAGAPPPGSLPPMEPGQHRTMIENTAAQISARLEENMQKMIVDAMFIAGVSEKQVEAMAAEGLTDWSVLSIATDADLKKVKGVGPSAVEKIRQGIDRVKLEMYGEPRSR